MKFEMKKSHISTAVALAICGTFVTSAQAAPVFLSDGAGTATTIADAGYFQPGGVGLSYLGREFVNWDTLASNYTLEANGATVAVGDEVSLSNPFSSITYGPIGGPITVTTNLGGAGGGWGFLETVSITAPGHVSVMVQLTNLTGSDAKDVYWGVGFDPDQGRGAGLGNGTFNVINATGTSDSSVSASTSDGAIITLANNTSAGAFDIRPYVDPSSCCSPVSPGLMLATAQAAGSYGFGDNSINLAYNLGAIANNDSVKIGYEYIMAVPEPETYAMLLAGLGLIGFSARRRISA
jgi:hypothetical protein